MALLTPLGLIGPYIFKAGDAWGEWGVDVLEKLLGYAPEGLKRYADLWKAPLPDYSPGGQNGPLGIQLIAYLASGFIGVLLACATVYCIARFRVKREK